MPRRELFEVRLFTWAGLALLACLMVAPAVWADEPALAIRMVGGESAVYPASSVERVHFEDATVIVVSDFGTDAYAAEEIRKIEFLWDPETSSTPEEAAQVLKALRLFQNQPNPFSPETRIAFELPQAGPVDLRIYHASGRLVRTLLSGTRVAGRHAVHWDGRDDGGEKVAGGVYFYQLRAPGVEESRRMILLP